MVFATIDKKGEFTDFLLKIPDECSRKYREVK